MSKEIKTFIIHDMIVTVELASYSYRNCYAQASYTVTAPNTLTQENMAELRAAGAFMYGQETGRMGEPTEQEDGSFMYSAYSCCDSGD